MESLGSVQLEAELDHAQDAARGLVEVQAPIPEEAVEAAPVPIPLSQDPALVQTGILNSHVVFRGVFCGRPAADAPKASMEIHRNIRKVQKDPPPNGPSSRVSVSCVYTCVSP
jgi:hypothetical protein